MLTDFYRFYRFLEWFQKLILNSSLNSNFQQYDQFLKLSPVSNFKLQGHPNFSPNDLDNTLSKTKPNGFWKADNYPLRIAWIAKPTCGLDQWENLWLKQTTIGFGNSCRTGSLAYHMKVMPWSSNLVWFLITDSGEKLWCLYRNKEYKDEI